MKWIKKRAPTANHIKWLFNVKAEKKEKFPISVAMLANNLFAYLEGIERVIEQLNKVLKSITIKGIPTNL